MTAPRVPAGLADGGRTLWRRIAAEHTLDESQKVQLLEACRCKDRLDKLDQLLRRDVETWAELLDTSVHGDGSQVRVVVDDALAKANQTANMLKQLLAALRLPEEAAGARPQRRPARGAYQPRTGKVTPTKVSSLDRARQRAGA